MSGSVNRVENDNLENHRENGVAIPVIGTPLQNPDNAPRPIPEDAGSRDAQQVDENSHTDRSIQHGDQQEAQKTPARDEQGVSLHVIFKMLQAQQLAIAQLQSHPKTPSTVAPKTIPPVEQVSERASNNNRSIADPAIVKTLEDLTKSIESGEKVIAANDKKIGTYNFRVDQIPGSPPVLKGVDSKKFAQRPFLEETALKPIPKKFRMPELPKYNGTSDPDECVTSYTCAAKGNGIKSDEIGFVFLKKFGETLSKGAAMWYHNLASNSIDPFAMQADPSTKAHAGALKVATKKSDVFKIKQRENETLREFVSRFQMERMELPLVSDDWAVQVFTQGLNERSSVASKQSKQNLIKYPAVTWSDVHNQYQSEIRAEDDQLGAPSGSVYPSRLLAKESKSNKERYPQYIEDRRNAPRCNLPRNGRRMDRGQYPRRLINRARFDRDTRPTGAPCLSEYNFNVAASDIVFTISKTRDAKWPRPI
ncbi:uncharacterized protein [Nicotiana sylvestris]|uniref:uncharacterized protein n=1 Tax=Nicotiana sylvestris TaxID=4096 RepID=UPI00388CAE81